MVKLFLRIFFVTLGLIIIVFVGIYFTLTSVLEPQPFGFKPSSKAFSKLLAAQLEQLEPEEIEAGLQDTLDDQGWPHEIVDRSDPSVPNNLKQEFLAVNKKIAFPNEYHSYFYVPVNHGKHVLVIGPVYYKEGPPPGRLHIFFSIAVLVVGLAAVLISMPTWRRIKSFELATIRLAEGDMSARARDVMGGPIGDLARRFNHMADSLQNYFESQKHLLQAVSHELRTPVARIHFELDLLEEESDDAGRKRRTDGILEHLAELNTMLDELLSFVRLDHDTPLNDVASISLNESLDKLVKDFQPLAGDKTLRWDAGEDVQIRVNPRLFQRALGNLIQNALRYTQSEVVLAQISMDDTVSVSVCDDGAGIPEDAREKVFEPFARLDTSRNKKSGGVGLGLAIAKRILQRHGGSIRADASPSGGAAFVTVWPKG